LSYRVEAQQLMALLAEHRPDDLVQVTFQRAQAPRADRPPGASGAGRLPPLSRFDQLAATPS
jgi:hypothetical protein